MVGVAVIVGLLVAALLIYAAWQLFAWILETATAIVYRKVVELQEERSEQ